MKGANPQAGPSGRRGLVEGGEGAGSGQASHKARKVLTAKRKVEMNQAEDDAGRCWSSLIQITDPDHISDSQAEL